MRFLLGLLGIDITLATVIPYQHVLHISKDSKLQSLHADESSNSNRPSPALPASTFVDPQDRGLRLDTSQQWSGYLSSNNETNLFFWMFESRKDPDNDPVILWLGGNPEGSSILNALTHWGPKHMVQDEFVDNPAAMNEAATVVFVDFLAGAGTGFSYTTDGTTTDRESFARSTSNVVQFLETLVKTSFGGRTFSGRDLHISGEYYAGLFIPSIANTIVSQPPADRLNLKSIMIGNGWLDALTQQKSIYQQRCDAELTSNLNRMLGDDECGYWRASLQDCEKAIVECRGDAASCARLEERCSESEARGSDSDKGRQQDRDSERSQVWKFLMDSKSYLGVDDQRIKDGEQRASSRKRLGTLGSLKANGDYTRDSIPDLGSLLSIAEPGFRVLLFAGTEYLRAPYIGTQAVARKIEWPGQDAFHEALHAPHYGKLETSADGRSYGEYIKASDSDSKTLIIAAVYGEGDTEQEETGAKLKTLLYDWIFREEGFHGLTAWV